jgi:hypothetical protein
MNDICEHKDKGANVLSSAQRDHRRPYQKPRLNRFGSVAKLTAGVSGGIGESGTSNSKKPTGPGLP